jgi:REP element-mobilizing transposase RayT
MKPGVFSQLYIHLVFAVANHECLLKNKDHNEIIFKYVSGIITNRRNKSIIVNGIDDHIHIFTGLNPANCISDLVADIKRSSSIFINSNKWFYGTFAWQEGYGAFSYSRSEIDAVYKYIQNQETHHRQISFKTEYTGLLRNFEIGYDEKYLFQFFEQCNPYRVVILFLISNATIIPALQAGEKDNRIKIHLFTINNVSWNNLVEVELL